MWKFGLQAKDGSRHRFEIENNVPFIILKWKVFELTNIPPEKQLLKTGRPPKIIEIINEDIEIKDVGNQLQNMDLIIVDETDSSGISVPPPQSTSKAFPTIGQASSTEYSTMTNDYVFGVPPSQSTSKVFPTIGQASSTEYSTMTNAYVFGGKIEPQPISFSNTVITRKIIPADNSCLFASILHCLKPVLYKRNKRLTSKDLRTICSDWVKKEVQLNPTSNLMDSIIAESDGKLTNPEEYSKRILNSDSWGGYVECKILSEYFQLQIVAGNIEIGTFNKYPDDNNKFGARIYILYDGIHYDACERGNGNSIFRSDDKCEVYGEVAMVLFDLKEKKQYTNTNTFSLVCQVCFKGIEGEKEARAHAQETGHQNFAQK